jgi:predicted CopG family antitoxin
LDMKTITISDDAYRRLSSIKAGMSFSEAIERLITDSVGVRIDRLLELGSKRTGREDELAAVVAGIRHRTKARTR